MDKLEAIERFKQAREKRRRLDDVLDEVYTAEEATELKQVIATYFATKLSKEMQRLADEKGWMEFQYQPTYYRRDEEGEYLTLFGNRVSPFRGKFDWSDPKVFEKDIDKE